MLYLFSLKKDRVTCSSNVNVQVERVWIDAVCVDSDGLKHLHGSGRVREDVADVCKVLGGNEIAFAFICCTLFS